MRSSRFAENKLLGVACSTSGLTLVFLFLRMSHFGSKPSSSTFRRREISLHQLEGLAATRRTLSLSATMASGNRSGKGK